MSTTLFPFRPPEFLDGQCYITMNSAFVVLERQWKEMSL